MPSGADLDHAARLAASLDTQDGSYYDIVLAISQDMINENIKKIHESNPVLTKCNITSSHGDLSGSILPRMIIPEDVSKNELCWQIEFQDKAVFRRKYAQGDHAFDAAKWVFNVKVPLALGEFKPVTSDTVEETKRKQKLHESLKNFLDYPFDCSIWQLYALLADAWWLESNIDEQKSYILDKDKNLIYLSDKSDENQYLVEAVKLTIKLAAQEYSKKGPSSIQAKPKSELLPSDPFASFQPGVCRLQTYAFVPPQAGRSSLLYCGTVAKSWRTSSALKPGGSFATENLGGTVTMSPQFFFERFILGEVRRMMRELEVIPLKPVYDDHTYHSDIKFEYRMGSDETTSDAYNFKRVDGDKQKFVYELIKDNPVEEKRANPTTTGLHSYFKSTASNRASVQWVPGESLVQVHGACDYEVVIVGRYDENFNVDKITDNTSFCYDKIEARWQVKFQVQTSGDAIVLTMQMPDNYLSATNSKGPSWDIEFLEHGQDEGLRKQMEDNLRTRLLSYQDQVFQKKTKPPPILVIWGHGHFECANPVLSNSGGLVADIKYTEKELNLAPKNSIVAHALHGDDDVDETHGTTTK